MILSLGHINLVECGEYCLVKTMYIGKVQLFGQLKMTLISLMFLRFLASIYTQLGCTSSAHKISCSSMKAQVLISLKALVFLWILVTPSNVHINSLSSPPQLFYPSCLSATSFGTYAFEFKDALIDEWSVHLVVIDEWSVHLGVIDDANVNLKPSQHEILLCYQWLSHVSMEKFSLWYRVSSEFGCLVMTMWLYILVQFYLLTIWCGKV